MTCSACTTSNDPGRRFCGACGRRLMVGCGVCGFDNGTADRFCGGCGAEVEAKAPEVAKALDRRVPAPPRLVPPPLPTTGELRPPPNVAESQNALSLAELTELFRKPTVREEPAPLGKVSQDELDRLFS